VTPQLAARVRTLRATGLSYHAIAATRTASATRATLNTDRRNVVNAIKIATYNAERLLARHFFQHYTDPRDWLTVFRAVLHLPGAVRHGPGERGAAHDDRHGTAPGDPQTGRRRASGDADLRSRRMEPDAVQDRAHGWLRRDHLQRKLRTRPPS